jgi:transcriptional regulator with XRE-family HTH domain
VGTATADGDTVDMSFGSHLREYREHRGWSLADLSNATTYSRGHLSNIENDRKEAHEWLRLSASCSAAPSA